MTLDEALEYSEERNWGLVEITPTDVSDDARTMILIDGDGQQILAEIGWGAAGLFVDVRTYEGGEPTTPVVLTLGDGVTVSAPLTH